MDMIPYFPYGSARVRQTNAIIVEARAQALQNPALGQVEALGASLWCLGESKF